MQKWRVPFVVFIGGILPSIALTTNGLNMSGYAAESVAMGGADVAVARDTSALKVWAR